ncbi:MAG: ATP cone domain-containing protein [Pseudomonadota bacterium]
MSKLLVYDQETDQKVPFLRGMLTRSLQNAGLDFVDAYQLASDIRDDFDDNDVVSLEELRGRILEILEDDFPGTILQRYQKENTHRENLVVVDADGEQEPFSRGLLTQRLMNASIPVDEANAVANRIHTALLRENCQQITTDDLIRLAYRDIARNVSKEHAEYYLVWNEFLRSNTPLIIMVGGVPGSGKSTIATELANQLNIVRTQSTDMLREVMRVLIPERLSPELHRSSFEAGESMDRSGLLQLDDEIALLNGYIRQAEMVEVACQAVIKRAISERVSVIMEGVHLRPSLMQQISSDDAIVIPVTLGVLDKKRLERYIKGRSSRAKKRRAERYLASLDKIWQLQTLLLSDADNADVEIINNLHRQETISEMIKTIVLTVHTQYKPELKKLRQNYAL